MKKIGFYLPHLDITGTGVCCFDYAYYNEKILKNKSVFICDKNHPSTHSASVNKFKSTLELIELPGLENMSLLKQTCKEQQLDALYIITTGKKDLGRYIDEIPTFMHVTGVNNEPHGTVYAYVSEWLSNECSKGSLPFVPHIVSLPETNSNLRQVLNIPENAVVFGRTGGTYSWNIPFVNTSIEQVLEVRKDIYFLFANTNRFINHERVLFHEPFADLVYKRKFINTCDALIHARGEGESFGLTVAEFSSCNKPVVTYYNSPETNHIFTLKEKGLYYTDENSLFNILLNFKPNPQKNWNAYESCTPDRVMQKFNDVFIKKI